MRSTGDSNTTWFEVNAGTIDLSSAAKSVSWQLVLEGKMRYLQGQSHEVLLAACVQ